MKRIAVIGGGASGLTAALFASQKGKVVLFEKQKKIGRKILVTGNGRCNLANRHLDASRYHGHNPRFALNVFGRFGLDETVALFESMGVPLAEGKEGRLYPASLQASTVPRVMEYELLRRGVEIRLHRRIEKILPGPDGIRLVTAGNEEDVFDAVVLAAGSCAYPPAGASRIGYELASSLGHRIYEPFPAILPLAIPMKALHRLEGIKWDCRMYACARGKTISEAEGELLFTSYGISGPASLDVSRAVNETCLNGVPAEITVDFFPECSGEDLRGRLDSLWSDGEKNVSFSMIGILKERMPEVLLGIAGVDPNTRAGSLSGRDKDAIVKTLKGLRLRAGEPRGFSEAVVAAGGVDVDEIDPATMESRLVKNLFITGELLDIDGDSGGYNLQFAWSTGAAAGMSQ